MTAPCPVCEAQVDLSMEVLVHELVDCSECATELENRLARATRPERSSDRRGGLG